MWKWARAPWRHSAPQGLGEAQEVGEHARGGDVRPSSKTTDHERRILGVALGDEADPDLRLADCGERMIFREALQPHRDSARLHVDLGHVAEGPTTLRRLFDFRLYGGIGSFVPELGQKCLADNLLVDTVRQQGLHLHIFHLQLHSQLPGHDDSLARRVVTREVLPGFRLGEALLHGIGDGLAESRHPFCRTPETVEDVAHGPREDTRNLLHLVPRLNEVMHERDHRHLRSHSGLVVKRAPVAAGGLEDLLPHRIRRRASHLILGNHVHPALQPCGVHGHRLFGGCAIDDDLVRNAPGVHELLQGLQVEIAHIVLLLV
mmetsp:Transcript_17866/g.37923  ORF Transcript_17866/g.37923 Transcript_17866/m.37923 type:complete len:318 (+) Transcript_17866:95-1048(+)